MEPNPAMVFSRILVRAPNWVGDAIISLPAFHALRARFPGAHLAVLARPWVADVYRRDGAADNVIPYTAPVGARGLAAKWGAARSLRPGRFDCAILLQNAFEAAMLAFLARIPRRIGYDRDGRGILLTNPIPVPRPGEIGRHESCYYLELLRRAEIIGEVPAVGEIRLGNAEVAREQGARRLAGSGIDGPLVGVSPGAAFGSAKRWPPERFAAAAVRVASALGGPVALFGAAADAGVCAEVERGIMQAGVKAHNLAGRTSLGEFIELAAACRVFLTNDSGAMHVAAALAVPTVAVFGPTDHLGTGPVGPWTRVVVEPVDCAPCKLRECPIDHRCMLRVAPERVAEAALDLLK
jgi:heptosyltransferase-2